MDRQQVYRGELPYETDALEIQQFAYEALGLALLDVLGATTVVGGLPCAPTSPASLNVTVGPGRIYTKANLDNTPIGQLSGIGGLPADTTADHQILKQGLLRDTATFAITPPVTAGQSQVYLVQCQFQEADDATTLSQFYNTANPAAPISVNVSPARRNKCILNLKPGLAATTGSQVAPTPDAGWTPLWTITVANGQTTITSAGIGLASGAPFVSSLQALAIAASTAALIWAGADNTKYVTAKALKDAQAFQTLTDGTTVTPDMSAGINFQVTFAGNRTMAALQNPQPGATFCFALGQDATGSRTPSWNSFYDWGAIGAPTLSTGANKVDYAFGVVDPTGAKAKMTFWKAA